MNWLEDIFLGGQIVHSCVIIALVIAIGIALGKIKIYGISLGLSFVFFVGIVFGHFGISIDPIIAEFAQSFGLSLFVFNLGMQVGPSFFVSIRSGGISLNLLSIVVVALNIMMTIFISIYASIPMNQMIGVLSGAVTNTPSLGAAQQSLLQMGGASDIELYDMAYACAVSYPFGVIGAILVVAIINGIFKRQTNKLSSNNISEDIKSNPLIVGVIVKNKLFSGKKINTLQSITNSKLIVTRIIRDNNEITTLSESKIMLNDTLLVTISEANKHRVINLIGKECDIEWNTLKSELISKKIFVTKADINGKSIEALQIRKNYNVNITRVYRAGIFLIAQNDLKLFVGDRVVLVGESKNVKCVENLLGNAIKKIYEPQLFTIFTGIAMGIILGSIPIAMPGMSVPIKIGLAGGTIIIGILMGAFGYRLKFNTFTTMSANLMLRELGIVLYLSSLGIASGAGFVNSLITGNGIQWITWGALITIVPIIIVGYISIRFMKKDIPTTLGMLCGSMANAPALSYTTDITGKSSAAVSYATVYPLTMFLRVVSAQILVMIYL